MSNFDALEQGLRAAIAAASDEAAIEAVRIEALGKKGSVSELLKTLGSMSPEERKEKGPLINGLREAVTSAIADKKAALEATALNARLATERLDMTLPAPATPRQRC
mgnify:CR=1 FL=1